MASLSVITPTIARPSLRRTMHSITSQLGPDDEMIVVADGTYAEVRRACQETPGCRYLSSPRTNQWGNLQRDLGIAQATGTHIAFCDDDDIFQPWAFSTIKSVIEMHPDAMLLFKVQMDGYRAVKHPFLWAEKVIRDGNIPSCGIVVPRRPDLPSWSMSPNAYAADLYFARVCAEFCEVIWREEVIARTRPA